MSVANEGKRSANLILAKTENMYGYRKKRQAKRPSIKVEESPSGLDLGGGAVTESMEIRRENEKKRNFYRKIGCLVEMDSKTFLTKTGEKEKSKKSKTRRLRERPNQSERTVNPKAQKMKKNFQSSGVGKRESNAPRFKTRNTDKAGRGNEKKRKARKETASERRERIRKYKKMRFVGLKSKKKKQPKREFGTLDMADKPPLRDCAEVSKTTPIHIKSSIGEICTPTRVTGSLEDTRRTPVAPKETDEAVRVGTRRKPEAKLLKSSLSKDLDALENPEAPDKATEPSPGQKADQEESQERVPNEEKNIEIQSCRIERNVEKMLFDTGSAKNLDIEVQNEIDIDPSNPVLKFPGGARSPSDMSNDFKSESASRLRMFEDVPMSTNSMDQNFNIDDLRNFHKKRTGPAPAARVEVTKDMLSDQATILGESRRLTLREKKPETPGKFKKNYSNAHLQKREPPREDFLDPKFDSAIPKITRIIQGKAPLDLQGSESLEFLLTSNAERPRAKMLDVKELTNDMDMIINGIDSMILSRQPQSTLKTHLSEAAGEFEYSLTNAPKRVTKAEVRVSGPQRADAKGITNLLSEDESPMDAKRNARLADADLQKMKRDLNLKASTQEMRDYLSLESSEAVVQSHPFLDPEMDRAELRKSLEKYEANLERIEEESNQQTKDSSYIRERALKLNEDPFEEAIKFQVTKDPVRRPNKPPMRR